MKEFDSLQNWIHTRKNQDSEWELSDATVDFIIGLENDLAELSKTIGIDLCIMTIKHLEDPEKKKNDVT